MHYTNVTHQSSFTGFFFVHTACTLLATTHLYAIGSRPPAHDHSSKSNRALLVNRFPAHKPLPYL